MRTLIVLALIACGRVLGAQAVAPGAATARDDASVRCWVETARAEPWNLPADVDFARDPLCRIGALVVSQRDFTRWIALVRGTPLVEARLLQLAAADAARESRDWLAATDANAALAPARLSTAQFSAVLDAWCRAKGFEREAGEQALATALRLPREAALAARRAAIEAVIDFCAGRGDSAEPPPSTRALFVEARRWREVEPLLALLETWRRAPDTREGAEALAAASEPLAVYLTTLRRELKLQTGCTFLDHELPGLAVAAFAPLARLRGAGDAASATTSASTSASAAPEPARARDEAARNGAARFAAPWNARHVELVDAAPIASAVLPSLSDAELRAELRALVCVLALRRASAERAGPRDDAAAWSAAVELELASQRAILGDEAIALLYDGFPHTAVWRAWREARAELAAQAWPRGLAPELVSTFADAAAWTSADAARGLELRAFDDVEAARAAALAWRETPSAAPSGRVFQEARYARLVHASSVTWRAQATLAPGEVSEPLAFGALWVVARRTAMRGTGTTPAPTPAPTRASAVETRRDETRDTTRDTAQQTPLSSTDTTIDATSALASSPSFRWSSPDEPSRVLEELELLARLRETLAPTAASADPTLR